jgi:hypothetical protein
MERAVTSTKSLGVAKTAAQLPPLFIDGYFTQRVKAGDRPSYGYPKNHLPETEGESEVVTIFSSPPPAK